MPNITIYDKYKIVELKEIVELGSKTNNIEIISMDREKKKENHTFYITGPELIKLLERHEKSDTK